MARETYDFYLRKSWQALVHLAAMVVSGKNADGTAASVPVAIAFDQSAIPLSIADGANATQGAIADAVVAAGAAGTLSAKLRRLTTDTAAVLAACQAATPAGEAHLGAVGGDSLSITPILAVTTAVYAAGNSLGGKLTLTNAMRLSGGSGIWQSCLIIDKDNQKPALDILLFDSDPTSGTYTDKMAIASLSTDAAKLIRRLSVAASDYVTVNNVAIADLSAIGKVVKASGSANLFAVINNLSTPTFTSTTSFIVRFGFLRD
jgi:hypothetical protein